MVHSLFESGSLVFELRWLFFYRALRIFTFLFPALFDMEISLLEDEVGERKTALLHFTHLSTLRRIDLLIYLLIMLL